MHNGQTYSEYNFYFSSGSNEFWKEIGSVISEGFEKNGLQVQCLVDAVPAETDSRIANIVVGGHEFINTFLKLHEPDIIDKVIPYTIALTGEQPGSQWFSANLPILSKCRECWDITESGAAALRQRGISAKHIQLGYSPNFEFENRDFLDKDLDVFFIGSNTFERAVRIADYGLNNWQRNNHFQLVEIGYAKTNKDKIYLPNRDRNHLAARSKVTLNYHGHLIPFFEWHRALIAMSNESLFITDPVRGSDPLKAGIHYISSSPNAINQVAEYFLENEEHRKVLTRFTYDFIKNKLSTEQCVKKFLLGPGASFPDTDSNQVGQFEKIHLDLKRFIQHKTICLFPSFFGKSCVEAKTESKQGNNKSEVITKRSKLLERLEQENLLLETGRAYDIEHYPAEDTIPTGKVSISVVISLFNYAKTLSTALDSILFAIDDTTQVEIIIVDDSSTDESHEVAQQWLTSSKLKGKLIRKKFNTGFICSRNIGIQEASGRYVAILDADNAYLPGGLQRLINIAEKSHADACYGIIVCVDESGKACGLLSSQGWDEKRLVYCPYIDAMALFRKDKLLEIGLYDKEMFKVGWFGWEDYELWLRFAEQQCRVEFLANFVGLYRAHSTSMINSTNLFQKEICDYLYAKHRNLVHNFMGPHQIFGVPKTAIIPS